MTTFVFPGQGSQYKGMGGELFDEFRELTKKADEILGYSIKSLCLEDSNQQLSKTQFTQPALYVVNALSYLNKIQESGKKPQYVAGHSLGEYNALFAAGVFDFETGLRLVKKRGELMSQAVNGGMAAVLGLDIEQVQQVLKENGLLGIDIANQNTNSQIVIAGPNSEIERADLFFENAGATMYIPLNVSGAFHSRYMDNAKNEFRDYIEQFDFSEIKIPIISNVNARPYNQSDIKANLIKQITHSVKWADSIHYLIRLGETKIEEIGPGNVLTKLIEKILKEIPPIVISKDEEKQENKEEQLNKENIPTQQGVEKQNLNITASSLGDIEFKTEYNLKYAYLAGAMYKGISSEKMVIKLGKAGMLGFYGTNGISLERIERAIQIIQHELNNGETYGMNLLHTLLDTEKENKIVDLFLKYQVRIVEASSYVNITPALVRYRLKGLERKNDGTVICNNKIIAKVSRPEVAKAFLSPAPKRIIEKMIQENKITQEEVDMLKEVPMADDLCVEADSGGHTDQGVAYALMPAMIRLRDEMMKKYEYKKKIRIGAAGGIGTPEAAAAAFILGAGFVVTGSINQCSVEANTSDTVKEMLQQANVQDTEYAPSEDMFEMGGKVQVLKKGLFFPARANQLYNLYRQYNSIDEIEKKTKQTIQEKFFNRSFEEVYEEVKSYSCPQEIGRAEQNPKYKMALIFKWYFKYSVDLGLNGIKEHKVNYQIHCGPAIGAFNQWVKDTPFENWRNRYVDQIGEMLMEETADLLNQRIKLIIG